MRTNEMTERQRKVQSVRDARVHTLTPEKSIWNSLLKMSYAFVRENVMHPQRKPTQNRIEIIRRQFNDNGAFSVTNDFL